MLGDRGWGLRQGSGRGQARGRQGARKYSGYMCRAKGVDGTDTRECATAEQGGRDGVDKAIKYHDGSWPCFADGVGVAAAGAGILSQEQPTSQARRRRAQGCLRQTRCRRLVTAHLNLRQALMRCRASALLPPTEMNGACCERYTHLQTTSRCAFLRLSSAAEAVPTMTLNR